MTKNTGVTLIELLISIVLLGILATLAVQTYSSLVVNSQLSSQSNTFLAALHNARAEAISRGRRVTICRSDDPMAATPACVTNSNTWERGWIMFIDNNMSGAFDGAETVADILQRGAAFSGNNRLVVANGQTNFKNYISYTQSGYARAAGQGGTIQNGVLYVCGRVQLGTPPTSTRVGRQITIDRSGSPRSFRLDRNVAASATLLDTHCP